MAEPEQDEIVYEEGCPGWMLTMGDCMSLLLTFFVLLLSFSTPNEDKLLEALGAMSGALSVVAPPIPSQEQSIYRRDEDEPDTIGKMEEGAQEKAQVDRQQVAPVDLRSMTVVNRFNEFQDQLRVLGFENIINSQQLKEGIMIAVPIDNLFEPGSVRFARDSVRFLQNFANLVSSIGNEVRITVCFLPTGAGSAAMSAWDLSRNRSIALVDYLARQYSIPKYRFSYGVRGVDSPGDQKVELLIAEHLGTKEVELAELLKLRNPR